MIKSGTCIPDFQGKHGVNGVCNCMKWLHTRKNGKLQRYQLEHFSNLNDINYSRATFLNKLPSQHNLDLPPYNSIHFHKFAIPIFPITYTLIQTKSDIFIRETIFTLAMQHKTHILLIHKFKKYFFASEFIPTHILNTCI